MTTRQYILGLGLAAGVASTTASVMMLVTSPAGIGPVIVTLWFVLVVVAVATLSTLALYGAKAFFKIHTDPRRRLKCSWRQGWLIAIGLTAMLALSSLGQFGIRDAVLLGLLLSIAEVYVRFRWP